jgi:hypothetical protein
MTGMALDVFVMPLWRFKTGDFDTAAERLVGDRVVYATAPDAVGFRHRLTGWRARRQARSEVRAIARAVSRANGGADVRWPDDGPVVYSNQSRTTTVLRAYIYWLDRQESCPHFEQLPSFNYDQHPIFQIERDKPSSYGQLASFSFCNGYLLPSDFQTTVEVEPYMMFGILEAYHAVASSIKVLRELDRVNQTLRVPDDYQWTENEPLADVKAAIADMRRILSLSCRHRLPVIFWG